MDSCEQPRFAETNCPPSYEEALTLPRYHGSSQSAERPPQPQPQPQPQPPLDAPLCQEPATPELHLQATRNEEAKRISVNKRVNIVTVVVFLVVVSNMIPLVYFQILGKNAPTTTSVGTTFGAPSTTITPPVSSGTPVTSEAPQGDCHIKDGVSRMAKAYDGHAQPQIRLYQCETDTVEDAEVHVLAVYQPIAWWKGSVAPGTITVELHQSLSANRTTSVRLALMSHDPVAWVVQPRYPDTDITLTTVAVVSLHGNSSTLHAKFYPQPSIMRHHGYYGYGNERTAEMTKFVLDTFGFMTTFHGIYEATGWTLYAGVS